MTRYDFLWCRPVVLITDPQLYIIPLLVNFSCEFEHIFQFWIGVLHIPKSKAELLGREAFCL